MPPQEQIPNSLPLSVAREPLEKYGLQQVIMLCMDSDGVHHIVTYGKNKEQCKEAGLSGDRLKKLIGWPDNTLSRYAREQQALLREARDVLQRIMTLPKIEPGAPLEQQFIRTMTMNGDVIEKTIARLEAALKEGT